MACKFLPSDRKFDETKYSTYKGKNMACKFLPSDRKFDDYGHSYYYILL